MLPTWHCIEDLCNFCSPVRYQSFFSLPLRGKTPPPKMSKLFSPLEKNRPIRKIHKNSHWSTKVMKAHRRRRRILSFFSRRKNKKNNPCQALRWRKSDTLFFVRATFLGHLIRVDSPIRPLFLTNYNCPYINKSFIFLRKIFCWY